MRGDFTRNTFDATKHLSRVLMQQGRIQLDADFNEQDAILLRRLRLLARDLVGRHAAAADLPASFEVAAFKASGGYVPRDFSIAPGRYYVEGILCENDAAAQYTAQPSFPIDIKDNTIALLDGQTYLVYLDVWERYLTYVEDPSIREVALGGPDTCSRARVIWQVRVYELTSEQADNHAASGEDLLDQFLLAAGLDSSTDPMLNVRASPDTRYSGSENHLYRVEVHGPGSASDDPAGKVGTATFKWSRDNGSVIFPIEETSGSQLTLSNLARNMHGRLQVGDWVEVVDDKYELRGRALPLLQVTEIQDGDRMVTLSDSVPSGLGGEPALHPYVRRWDQRAGVGEDGTLRVIANESDRWIQVEDGLQIKFSASGNYRTGDFWMIPARTVTADVEWPGEPSHPRWVTPHGIPHYYAPLAKLGIDAAGTPEVLQNYRRRAIQLWAIDP
jgi:hypothetical protein